MDDDARRNRLRATFDGVAERYDAVRPTYPRVLVDELRRRGGSYPGHRHEEEHMSDEATITTLIHGWAKAVHDGDLDAVLADHSGDIVMFDVPPPDNGVRGLAAYRAAWPPFFEFQRSGASFEIVDLAVTAGAEVAFAHALLRCGMPDELAEHPDHRLRLTVGLRKVDGHWVVTHEHHSFPARG